MLVNVLSDEAKVKFLAISIKNAIKTWDKLRQAEGDFTELWNDMTPDLRRQAMTKAKTSFCDEVLDGTAHNAFSGFGA